MRRRAKFTFGILASVVLFALAIGGGAYAEHTFQVEEHVVPYTIGTATGEYTITDTDVLPHETITVTETQTVTVTDTEPPPDLTQCSDGIDNDGDALIDLADPGCVNAADDDEFNSPPASGVCTTENYWNAAANEQAWTWDECAVGTTINVTNQEWACRQPLASYGPLPIKVVSRWSIHTANGSPNIAVSVNTGCTAPAGTDINLIVDVQNAGGGQISDAFKTRQSPGPQNIRITGRLGCGDRNPADHQDAIQLQGGSGIYFVNMDVGGNYEAGDSNCQGAGGTAFWSLNHSQAVILGGTYIGCNHSLNVGLGEAGSGSGVRRAKFRSGNDTTPFCSGFFTSPPCINTVALSFFENVVCQRFVNGQWVNQ